METNVAAKSIPSSIHEVDRPVPVPNSSNLPDGLEAARVLNNEQVNTSDAMVNPDDCVATTIL